MQDTLARQDVAAEIEQILNIVRIPGLAGNGEATYLPDRDSLRELLTGIDSDSVVAAFCLAGVNRSRDIMRTVKSGNRPDRRFLFPVIGLNRGHFSYAQATEVLERLFQLSTENGIPEIIIFVAYDPRFNEPQLLLERLATLPEADPEAILRGDLSSLGAKLVVVRSTDVA